MNHTIQSIATSKPTPMIEPVKKELLERIIRIRPELSPKKRRVADFMMEDYKRLFLMSAKEIAQRCEVSEPTITRFVTDLGFCGYGEFEQYLKGLLRIELTSVERLLKAGATSEQDGTLNAFCRNTQMNLDNMLSSVSEREVTELAGKIHAADKVMVAGYRLSAALAHYCGYLLAKVKPGVTTDSVHAPEHLDAIALSGGSLLLVMIAFPRYPRMAIEMAEYARKYSVDIVSVTDSLKSPLVNLSDHYVIIDIEGPSFVDPFAHIVTFLGALVHEVAHIDKAATAARLSRIEEGVRRRQDFYQEQEAGSEDYDPLMLNHNDNGKVH